MSLEQVIEKNTAAIEALIVALQAQGASNADVGTAVHALVEKELKEDKKPETKKSTAATAGSSKDATPAASEKKDNASEKPAASKEETEALYEKIKQPFLDLVASNRADAVALLAEIGAKQLKTADFDQLTKAAKILGVDDEELS